MAKDRSQWLDERVEPYLDGALSGTELLEFEQALAHDNDLQSALVTARRLRTQLRGLPAVSAPPRLKSSVLAATETAWRSPAWLAWGIAGAACLLLLLSAVLPQFRAKDSGPTQLTAEQIDQGRKDLALALGYLDHVASHASRKVGSAWINDGLIRPINDGLGPTGLNRRIALDKEEEA